MKRGKISEQWKTLKKGLKMDMKERKTIAKCLY